MEKAYFITTGEPKSIVKCQLCTTVKRNNINDKAWECKMCRRRICNSCVATNKSGEQQRFMVHPT